MSLASSIVSTVLTVIRDPSVHIKYTVVSEATFANRHSVDILWSKPQDPAQIVASADVEAVIDPSHFSFTMTKVATPDTKQSEAYIATAALFHIFNGNPKEEKVNLRLPTVWRDFWLEMAEAKKGHFDAQDRSAVKQLKALVRQRHDQELEDGVVLQGAFRGRNNAKASPETAEPGHIERSKHIESDDNLKKLWASKSSRKKYAAMLVCCTLSIGALPSIDAYIRNIEYSFPCGNSKIMFWML